MLRRGTSDLIVTLGVTAQCKGRDLLDTYFSRAHVTINSINRMVLGVGGQILYLYASLKS